MVFCAKAAVHHRGKIGNYISIKTTMILQQLGLNHIVLCQNIRIETKIMVHMDQMPQTVLCNSKREFWNKIL